MRQPEKKRRTVGIRGQLMWFLCFICLLLLVFRQGARHEGGELMDVTVSLQGRRLRCVRCC